MKLKFHSEALALIDHPVRISDLAARVLDRWEERTGSRIRYPPSVREWYTLSDAVEILGHYSNDDRAVPVHELKASSRGWDPTRPSDPKQMPVFEFLVENQAVCVWGIQLNGTDDPPVLVVENESGASWLHCSDRFSTFVYTRIWDFQPWVEKWLMLEAQDEPLSPADLASLKNRFHERPSTYAMMSHPNVTSYRFDSSHGRIVIHTGTDSPSESRLYEQADWFLHAKSPNSLEALAREVWHCADLATTLYGFNEDEGAVLDRLRTGGHGWSETGRT